MFALSLALGALLCLAPSAAALENQPEVPAPDTAAASQTDTPAAPAEKAAPDAAEPAGQALTEEGTKEVTVTVEVPILPEKPPIQISYTTPEEIGFTWEEDGLELEVAEVLPVEEISLAPDPDADASAPEAPADSDDTNGTEAAAASDAPAQAPHTEAPAAAQPAAPAVPTLPQTGTTGWVWHRPAGRRAVPDVQSKAFLSSECSAPLRANSSKPPYPRAQRRVRRFLVFIRTNAEAGARKGSRFCLFRIGKRMA